MGSNDITEINTSPVQDVRKWDSTTSVLTPAILHYLWGRDPITQFVIDTLIEEAFRYGPILPSKEYVFPQWVMDQFILAEKYGYLYGVAALFFDTGESWDTLDTPLTPGKKVVDLIPLHMELADRGGIQKWRVDDMGNVEYLEYMTTTNARKIKIDRSRFTIFTGPKKDRDFRGHSVIEPLVDTIMGLRAWERTSAVRAQQFIDASHVLHKNAGWDPTELTEVKSMAGTTKVVITGGSPIELHEIGRSSSEGEIESFKDESWRNLSAGTGAAKTDMSGAEAGAKLSTDTNSSIRTMKLEYIQRNSRAPAEEMFEKLQLPSFKFTGWVDPREIPEDQRLNELLTMMMAYNSAVQTGDQEMIGWVRTTILDSLVNVI